MRKFISILLIVVTIVTMTISTSTTATAAINNIISAEDLKYVCFSAIRFTDLKINYTLNGKAKTLENDHGFLGFIARAIDKNENVILKTSGDAVYSYGICTEEDKAPSGGIEVGSSMAGVQDHLAYVNSNQTFSFSYVDGDTDGNGVQDKALPADWVFKCFYYANQIARENNVDINALKKGYYTDSKDKALSDLGNYNTAVKNGNLSIQNQVYDYDFAIQKGI